MYHVLNRNFISIRNREGNKDDSLQNNIQANDDVWKRKLVADKETQKWT